MKIFMPKISVVVFSYNFGKYISECLESIVNQTMRPYEIIVCDDCSTDDSWYQIQQFKEKYPDLFSVYRHEENIGHVKNGIFGKEQVMGNLISVIDGDDRWHPDKLKYEWNALNDNPQAKTAYSGVNLINEAGEKIGSWTEGHGEFTPPSGDVLIPTFAKRFFPQTRSLFRNQLLYVETLKEIGFREQNDKIIHADWNWKIRLSAKYDVVYSGQALVDYRQHATSISRRQFDKLHASAQYIISKNLPLLRSRSESEIDFVLKGINSLLTKLGAQIAEPVEHYTRANVFPPEVIVNSLPKSGTNLVTRLLSLMPGMSNSNIHLGNSTVQQLPAVGDTIPVGVDMPRQIPLSSISHSLNQLGTGSFLSCHIPYSEALAEHLKQHNLKMIIVLRDPRDVVLSHASYIADTPGHPLNTVYKSLTKEERISASTNGLEFDGIKLLSIVERWNSMLPWLAHPNVHVVKFEDVVGPEGGGDADRQISVIKDLADFLDVKLNVNHRNEITASLFGKSKTFRKGQIASWKSALTRDQEGAIVMPLKGSLEELKYEVGQHVHSSTQEVPADRNALLGGNLIFLASQPRSGSTLLQRVLGAHDEIHTLAEPWIMLHPLYALRQGGIQTDYNAQLAYQGLEDFIDSLPGKRNDYVAGIRSMASLWYGKAIESSDKSIFLDKTPRYYYVIPELAEVFPEAKLVLLVRNPLAVLSSILKTWVGKNWGRLQLHRDDILRAPLLMTNAMRLMGDRLILFRYEALVRQPEIEIKKLCARLGVPYDAGMLEYGRTAAPSGRMGDQVGIHNHSRPEIASLEKWKGTFTDPIYRLLAEIVLTLMGEDVVGQLGYNYIELLSKLRELPLSHSSLDRQEIVAMVSALHLNRDSLAKVEGLFTPYLTTQATMQATMQSAPEVMNA